MVTILGGLSEFKRALIRARIGEGLKRARERGIRSAPKHTRHISRILNQGSPMRMLSALASLVRAMAHPSLLDSTITGTPASLGSNSRSHKQ